MAVAVAPPLPVPCADCPGVEAVVDVPVNADASDCFDAELICVCAFAFAPESDAAWPSPVVRL